MSWGVKAVLKKLTVSGSFGLADRGAASAKVLGAAIDIVIASAVVIFRLRRLNALFLRNPDFVSNIRNISLIRSECEGEC
jgi:Na+-driven multidrug efflux pump